MASETKEVLEDVRAGKYEPWICLDTYLCAHLAELLTKMRDEGHSFPSRYNSVDEWHHVLTNLIRAFEEYDHDDPDAIGNAQDGFHYIANNLSDFWD